MEQFIGDNLSTKDILKRFRISVLILVLASIVLVGRMYYLQIYKGSFYTEKSQSNFIQFQTVPAPRGIIYDNKGEILADSRPSFAVYVTPAFCKTPSETLSKLDRYLNLTLEEYQAAQKLIKRARGLNRFRPQLIKTDINHEALSRILFFINELEGVNIFPKPHRRYKYGQMAAHLLGYVNEIGKQELKKKEKKGLPYRRGDYIGRGGIEQAFESDLHSINGEIKTVVDAKGKPMKKAVAAMLVSDPVVLEARAGMNIYLTIDAELQREAEKAFDDFGAQAGAMVAINPKNGEIIAMVSRPSFDPAELSGRLTRRLWHRLQTDPMRPLLHRAIQATYPPGSTFKAITAVAGLAEEKISPTEIITCRGYYMLGRKKFRDWKESGHGPMNVTTALRSSCDVFFYTVGMRLGTPGLMKYCKKLGLGERLGISLPNERPGTLGTVEWHNKHTQGGFTEGQTVNQAIGQGAITVNAMQLAVVYATIANGGTVFRPGFVKKITDQNGKLVKKFEPQIIRKNTDIPKEVFEEVTKGLTAVMNEPGGTAYWRSKTTLPKWLIGAGKTGTAQVVHLAENRKRKEEMAWHLRDHALFATFLPADNPEIAIAVIHEHGGHGGSDAAPIALNFAKRYFELRRGIN